LRTCAIRKRCFKLQGRTSEACASSSSSAQKVFVILVLQVVTQQKEAARKTCFPGEYVTFEPSATTLLICQMGMGISTARGSTETDHGQGLLSSAAPPGHHRVWWLSSAAVARLQPC